MSPPHQLPGVKSSFPGPLEFRVSLQRPDCSDSNGQHNCSLLHQQRGRYEIRLSLCPPLETPVLVSPQRHSSEGTTHSGSVECDGRQAAQTQPSDPDRVVPISAGVQSLVLQIGPATCRPVSRFNHKLPKFVSPVPHPTAWAVDALILRWGNLDAYAFPPVSLLSQVISKVMDQGCRRMIPTCLGFGN